MCKDAGPGSSLAPRGAPGTSGDAADGSLGAAQPNAVRPAGLGRERQDGAREQ